MNKDKFKRIYRDRNGNTWIQRKGHIFQQTRKRYKNGELIEETSWRGVVCINRKMYWKQGCSREVIEQWLKDIFTTFPKKEMIAYGKREVPKRVKAKYGPPVRVRGDGE